MFTREFVHHKMAEKEKISTKVNLKAEKLLKVTVKQFPERIFAIARNETNQSESN